MRKYLLLVFLSQVLPACSDAWEYSPNQKFDKNSPRDLNAKNLDRLYSTVNDDTITIAFVGDSQRFYNEVDKFIEKSNSIKSIDFVLLAGDISDFGLLQEFEWIADRLSKLDKPYLMVIGNHDIVANGEEVYKRMFGPPNQSFVYDSVKFILHNTNSLEYRGNSVPDLDWLSKELSQSEDVKYQIAVSHIPPYSNSDFKEDLEVPYTRLFAETPNLLASLHGHVHNHRDHFPYQDGVRYLTSYSFDKRSFVILKIINGNIIKSIVGF